MILSQSLNGAQAVVQSCIVVQRSSEYNMATSTIVNMLALNAKRQLMTIFAKNA